MAEVQGSYHPAFNTVRDLLQQKIADGSENGASLVINIDGKDVVDLWGGYKDLSQSKPWDKDTIACIWSSTKIPTLLAAHILVDRGLLDVNERVATYWPEFAANGKENVKVSHILSHSSGVPAFDGGITIEQMQDEETAAKRLAEQAPWFPPGTQSAYQYTNYGLLVGTIVQRITGQPLAQFISENITTPLGVDFQLGLSEKDEPRTAENIPFPPETVPSSEGLDPTTSILLRSLIGSLLDPTTPSNPTFRKSQNGASGGFSNARALATIGSIVTLDGVVNGKRILSSQTVDNMLKEQIRLPDENIMTNSRFALGLALPSSDGVLPYVPEEEGISFWGGFGGSAVIMDRGRRMTISYIPNKMEFRVVGNSRFDVYFPEIYKAFEAYGKA
ncbi:beta-lactamase [Penicillium angulare]|uniref:beta-lactamase n=1 Tax=Penicillium angulare TaxID=116970 RepID=UPI0025407B8D|nr:beta-lactamase [Penicillium angulare]KAJ5266787.1 beta-lactamase [Penicillium angulare]